jgi:hypothetical protein
MTDPNMRSDVLVTGPLMPFTGGLGASSNYWDTSTTDDGDLFCLGGFNWDTDINSNQPKVDKVGGKVDPGFSLILGPSELLKLSNNISMTVGSNGTVAVSSGYSNSVMLSRKWPYANVQASVSLKDPVKNNAPTSFTKLYFKWVHPSYVKNNINDASDTKVGNKWYLTLAATATAGGLVSVQGCKDTSYSSSSDLIFTRCGGHSVMGFGGENTSVISKHVKDGFLLRAYYPDPQNVTNIIPAQISSFTYNGETKTSSNYLYLHYHRIAQTTATGVSYESSGYLELLPIYEGVTAYTDSADQWAIDGGFLFDKGNFQFDWNDGIDGLPSWNVYHDPGRLIYAAMPDGTGDLSNPFMVNVSDPVIIPLNFMPIPMQWFNNANGLQYYNNTINIERQQCYRFHKNNAITDYTTTCSTIGILENYENYRGITQKNIADLTQYKTYYVSNRGCNQSPQYSGIYNLIPTSSGNWESATPNYKFYNSMSGYCAYNSSTNSFGNTNTFPVPGCGYDGDCSACSTDSCGDSICSKFVEDPNCKSTICSRAASLCNNVQGDPNWGTSSGSLIFIIILILAIFGLVIYYLYEKKQQNAALEGTTKKKTQTKTQTKTPQTSTRYRK